MTVLSWQPFDEDYLNHLEPPVKHMSFHAYIRKLTGGPTSKQCGAGRRVQPQARALREKSSTRGRARSLPAREPLL